MTPFAKYIDNRIKTELAKRRIPGVSVCIRISPGDNGILYSEAHGINDLQSNRKLQTKDWFLLASQSKTFIAVATLRLIERGYLNPDDKLIDLLPELKEHPDHKKLAETTVMDLLQHRAPLDWSPECYGDWDIGKKPYPSIEEIGGPHFFELLNLKKLQEIKITPEYSNPGFALLTAIMDRTVREKNLAASFGNYIQKAILEPNELSEVHPGLSGEEIARNDSHIVQGYCLLTDGTRKPVIKPAMLGCAGSGGFYGTVEQVSDFFHRLMSDDLLTETSLRQMLDFSKEFPFGMGLAKRDLNGETWHGHAGGMPGYAGITVHKDGVTIALAVNLCTLENTQEADRLVGSPDEAPLLPAIASAVKEAMQLYGPSPHGTAQKPITEKKAAEVQSAVPK